MARIAIVSACLLGIKCRYDGGDAVDERVIRAVEEELLIPIPVCPEQLAGLPTPRECCEIVGGDGFDVISGRAKVISESGRDLTNAFIKGAEEVLRISKIVRAEFAIMKDCSPSCGFRTIYDGTFSGSKRRGVGVTSAKLKLSGLRVLGPEEIFR